MNEKIEVVGTTLGFVLARKEGFAEDDGFCLINDDGVLSDVVSLLSFSQPLPPGYEHQWPCLIDLFFPPKRVRSLLMMPTFLFLFFS